ncbi:cytochrome P450 2J4-like [Ambystoma mexicanum]|uniref:cytochrome P450 2J4-like n=1 Tax=Ambystoma mexicanum TaxID=8296 RepID=UPI0037E7F5A0
MTTLDVHLALLGFSESSDCFGVALIFSSNPSIFPQIYDLFPQLMKRLPGPQHKVFRYFQMLLGFIKKEVRDHQENMEDEPADLIDHYLAQISKSRGVAGSTYNEANMIELVADLFITGTETTTTVLQWALLYMAVHPEIQVKVQQELDAALGPDQIVGYEDRKKLPYTNAVIHEILRYGNIVSVGIPRRCEKDIMLQGFPIQKGAIILPNLSSVLYDPEHWDTPHQFNPHHFLDEEGNFLTREPFLPFSAGHSVCLREQLARIELFIFFTSLLRAFTFQLPVGVKKVRLDYILLATLQPHPYRVCAVPHWMK